MVHYKTLKTIIDAVGLAKIIINMIVRYHSFFKSIISDRGLLFISKFWSSLYNFLNIKQKLSIVFYP